MTAPRWNPPVEIEEREEWVMQRLTRSGRIFAVLRRERHAILDAAFQQELSAMYRAGDEAKDPLSPAQLAMATLLQAYAGVSDAEAVDLATFDLRWQMALGTLGAGQPPFAHRDLKAFRERLIEHDMDRRFLERTAEFARASEGFDPKKLPKSL